MTSALKRQDLEKVIPLGRFGSTSEVADAALFLAKSPYVTGQVSTVKRMYSRFVPTMLQLYCIILQKTAEIVMLLHCGVVRKLNSI